LFAVGLHTGTAVARSLCVSWAFLLLGASIARTERVVN